MELWWNMIKPPSRDSRDIDGRPPQLNNLKEIDGKQNANPAKLTPLLSQRTTIMDLQSQVSNAQNHCGLMVILGIIDIIAWLNEGMLLGQVASLPAEEAPLRWNLLCLQRQELWLSSCRKWFAASWKSCQSIRQRPQTHQRLWKLLGCTVD